MPKPERYEFNTRLELLKAIGRKGVVYANWMNRHNKMTVHRDGWPISAGKVGGFMNYPTGAAYFYKVGWTAGVEPVTNPDGSNPRTVFWLRKVS